MSDVELALETAVKISQKAKEVLSGLEFELTRWPPEFRSIMWDAVARLAAERAAHEAMKK